MAELKEERLAREIYEGVGGLGNVNKIVHCMTRVRMGINDESQVDLAQLKKIDGVLGVVEDDTLQVIVGPGIVNKVAQKMVETAGVKLGDPISAGKPMTDREKVEAKAAKVKAEQKKKNQTPFKKVLKSISNIFVPLIPAFVGAGLIGGVAAVLANMMTGGQLSGENWTHIITVLNVIKNGIFAYLSIYVGINSASEFGASPGLGGVIGATIMLTGVTPETAIPNIFTGGTLAPGQGGIIGVIFAVWILALVEKRLHKIVPDSIDIILTPLISLLIVGLATIFLIMPIAGVISDSLVGGINWVLTVGGAFSGFVLGFAFLPLVMFGLHQVLTPIHLQMIEKDGMTLLLPILAMAGAGQVGAAIALWVRCKKNKELTTLIKGSLPVGILGIGEPLIYGVTLPLGRPFLTACIGGGVGGAIIGAIGGIGAISIGPSGVALLPLIANGKWWGYVLGILGAYVGGFLATYFFGTPKDAMVGEDDVTEAVEVQEQKETAQTVVGTTATKEAFVAVANGQVMPLSEVPDQVFSTKMMGEGYAVNPVDNQIVSPVNGKITSIFPTKHALGIQTDTGLEVLIHMGLETVDLKGAGFAILVDENQTITAGTPIATMDLSAIKEAGKEIITMVIVTNSEHLTQFVEPTIHEVKAGETVVEATVM